MPDESLTDFLSSLPEDQRKRVISKVNASGGMPDLIERLEAEKQAGAEPLPVEEPTGLIDNPETKVIEGALDDTPLGIGRDLVKGPFLAAGSGVGGAFGRSVGGLAGPLGMGVGQGLGMLAGGTIGSGVGDGVVDSINQSIESGSLDFAPLENFIEPSVGNAFESAANIALPFIGKKIGSRVAPAITEGIERSGIGPKLRKARAQILLALSPTSKSLDAFGDRVLDESIDRLIGQGFFNDTPTTKKLIDKVVGKIGKRGVAGELGTTLQRSVNQLDKVPGTAIDFQDLRALASRGLTRAKASTKSIDVKTGGNITGLADEFDSIFDETLDKFRQGLVPKETVTKYKNLLTKREGLQGQLDKFSNILDQVGNLDKINTLKSQLDNVLNELAPLEQAVKNPAVSFSQAVNFKQSLDKLARQAYDATPGKANPKTDMLRSLADSVRGHVNNVAGREADVAGFGDVGKAFLDANAEYSLLSELRHVLKGTNRKALMERAEKEAGQSGSKLIRAVKSNPLDRLGELVSFEEKTVTDNLFKKASKGLNEVSQFLPIANVEKAVDGSDAILRATGAILNNFVKPPAAEFIGRNISNLMQEGVNTLSETVNSLKIKFLREMGHDPATATFNDVGQEGTQQIEGIVAQEIEPLSQAIKSGNKGRMRLELANLQTAHSDLFESPKTGLAGEVKDGSDYYLPRQEDRVVYASDLLSDGDIPPSEKGRVLSGLRRPDGKIGKLPKKR